MTPRERAIEAVRRAPDSGAESIVFEIEAAGLVIVEAEKPADAVEDIPDAATHTFGSPPHCRTCGENGHTEEEHPRSTAPEAPSLGTERFPVKGALADLWSEQLGRGHVDPPSSL